VSVKPPLALLLLILAGACAAAPASPSPQPRTLAEVRTLDAVLDLAYDGPDRRGTFEAVCNYERGRGLRLTAFKDLVVLGSEPIFDLLLEPDRFALDVAARDGEPAVHDRGPLAAFPDRHPRFAGLFWAREALFLPGALGDDARHVPSGAFVAWNRAPGTLEVVAGAISAPRCELRLRYGDYQEAGDCIPRHVVYEEGGTRIEVRVKDLDVNAPLAPGVFEASK
jgi:hypothetical protein